MEKYKLEYRGNVKEFEDYILDNLRREQEQGQSLRWSKFVEVYARQLAIIQECPYPETESELGNDETPPSIKPAFPNCVTIITRKTAVTIDI